MSILVVFLFGIIAVFGMKLLANSRGQRQLARIEAIVAAEQEDLARRQAAHPEVWNDEAAQSFLTAFHDELRGLEATQIEQVSDHSFDRTTYELDRFVVTVIRAQDTWQVWLGWDERNDYPASFWLAALAGSADLPDREADYVALAHFSHQLPIVVSDWVRLEPLVTAIGVAARQQLRADLKSVR
jgi:hypothetical protein